VNKILDNEGCNEKDFKDTQNHIRQCRTCSCIWIRSLDSNRKWWKDWSCWNVFFDLYFEIKRGVKILQRNCRIITLQA